MIVRDRTIGITKITLTTRGIIVTKHQFAVVTPQMVRKFCKEHSTSAWLMFNKAWNDHADSWEDDESRILRDFVRFETDGFTPYYVRKHLEVHTND